MLEKIEKVIRQIGAGAEELNERRSAILNRRDAAEKNFQGEFRAEQLKRLEAELEAHDQSAAAHLETLRGRGRELLRQARLEVAAEHYRRMRVLEPQTPEQWAEAASRSVFIEADVETSPPDAIFEQYKAAKAAGDVVAAYLLLRFGKAKIEKSIREASEVGAKSLYRRVLNEMSKDLAAVEAERSQALERLETLGRELDKPVSGAEIERFREGVRQRFGLD